MEMFEHIPAWQLTIFTDSSPLGNPGFCGAAAICWWGLAAEPDILSKSVCSEGTSYQEWTSFPYACYTLHQTYNTNQQTQHGSHFQWLSISNSVSSPQTYIIHIKNFKLNWKAGHLVPNELAHKHANIAVVEETKMVDHLLVLENTIKS